MTLKNSSSSKISKTRSDGQEEKLLSDAEIEAILEEEGHLKPLDKLEIKPFEAVSTEPTKGRFAIAGTILMTLMALNFLWQALSSVFENLSK